MISITMPLSPELRRLPGIAASFYKAGLLNELMVGMMKGEMGRNMVEDARKLITELIAVWSDGKRGIEVVVGEPLSDKKIQRWIYN